MARRKPISGKQRKEQLQEKRAVKRGDVEKPEPSASGNRRHRPIGGRSQAQHRARTQSDDPSVSTAAFNAAAKVEATRKLQSTFRKVSPEFLALWRERASNEVLVRPIPEEKIHFDVEMVRQTGSGDLGTPKRPKWRYEMSKKEVERNEEGMFDKWRAETEDKIDQWRMQGINLTGVDPESDATEEQRAEAAQAAQKAATMRSPTFYEQNLEVWRQLWRVTELSSILLVLLDARCPPLHYPPSLHTYLSSLKPPRKIILVLTKSDAVGLERVSQWKTWLQEQYPDAKVVGVESYRIQTGKGSKVKHMPHIPPQSLSDLIDAMEASHLELLEPPEPIKSDPLKASAWVPRVRKSLNWEVVRRGEVAQQPVSSAVGERGFADDDDEEDGADGDTSESRVRKEVTEPLTIGLIGQPNVGKSSLLNALFGAIKVRASRTPGKTKHFQTLFWSPELKLVDCPGLVLPNLVPMELQVLSAILPISQMASMASCIHFAATVIPLERVFHLRHPSEDEAPAEDKRTWRAGMRAPDPDKLQAARDRWTAMDVMTAYANAKGWMTAKAGRPDVNRAGNAILRALADGRVLWAFEPPSKNDKNSASEYDGRGIWIPGGVGELTLESSEDDEEESDGNESRSDAEEESSDDEEEEEEEEEEISSQRPAGRATSKYLTSPSPIMVAKLTLTTASGTIQMPQVGFGLWKVDKATGPQTVVDAIKAGYRLFDSAGDYGNEKESGKGLAQAIQEGLVKREEVFITSKLWNTFHAKEHVEKLARKQLADWGIDYFDLFLIHFPISLEYVDPEHRYPPEWNGDDGKPHPANVPIKETWEAMETLVDLGLTKAIGLSNFNGAGILDVLRYAKKPVSALQIEHHPYLTQEPLIELCKSVGIAVTAYCSFGPASWLELKMHEGTQSLLHDNPTIASVAKKAGKTPAQVLLRWATQRGIAVIPKSNNKERLIQNLNCSDFDLDAESLATISSLNAGLRFNDPVGMHPKLAIFA